MSEEASGDGSSRGVAEELTFLSPSGRTLAGALHAGAGGAPVSIAVLCHGMLSSMRSHKHVRLAGALAAAGFHALRFDFSHRGRSRALNPDYPPDRVSFSDCAEDLAGAVGAMRFRHPGADVYLLGSSMGGSAALLYAAGDPGIAGIVTFASPVHPARPRPPHFSVEVLERWAERGHLVVAGNRIGASYLDDARRADILGAAARCPCPLLALHGTADEVVPFTDGEELARAAPDARLVAVEGGDHRFSLASPETILVEAAVAFLREIRERRRNR